MRRDFADWVADRGFDAESLNVSQRSTLETAWRADQGEEVGGRRPAAGGTDVERTNPAAAGFDEVMSEFRREEERQRNTTAVVARYLNKYPSQAESIERIGRLALEGHWDDKSLELALLKQVHSYAPTGLTGGGREASPDVIVAGLCRSVLGGSQLERAGIPAATLEQADKQFRSGLSVGELIVAAARRNGLHDASLRSDPYELLETAFRRGGPSMTVGSISTYSLPGLLGNAMNKVLLSYFRAFDQSWRLVASTRPASDFKEMTAHSLVGDYKFIEVPPGKRITHAHPGEVGYANKVRTYARLAAIAFQDIRNDDMGAFNDVGRLIARGAALGFNEAFWTLYNSLAANTVGNGNLITDNFDDVGLNAAWSAFQALRDPDGNPLLVTPQLLVVPDNYLIAARKLMQSTTITAGATAGGGDANPWSGMFTIVNNPYLGSTAFGGSPDHWHIQAAPGELSFIEAAFLDGREEPTVERVDVDHDILGLAIRGSWHWGVARQEFRARVSSDGSEAGTLMARSGTGPAPAPAPAAAPKGKASN